MLFIFRRKRVLIDLNGQMRQSIEERYTCRLYFPLSFGNVLLWIDSIKRMSQNVLRMRFKFML